MQKKMIALALAFAVAMLSGCTSSGMDAAPELKEPVGVQSDTAKAYVGEIFTIEQYDASVVPYVEELAFEVDGCVSEMNVYPGKWVEEGDVLIRLDQSSTEERVEELKKQIAYYEQNHAYDDALAELDIDIAETELKQLKARNADENEIALKENEIAQMKALLRQTQQQREPELQARKKELATLESSLDKNVIYAPFSGRIIYGLETLAEGAQVSAFDTLLYLADDTRLKLHSEYVSDSIFEKAYRIYALIGAEEYEIVNMPIDEEKYVSATLSGKTLDTWYEILGPEEEQDELEAGQYAAICIIEEYVSDALLVPSGAIYRDASGEYVYVDEDGERIRRLVEVGMTTDGLAQIISGLEEGELVYVKD